MVTEELVLCRIWASGTLEERQHVATLQLAADYYLANRINSVDLEH